MVAQISQNTGCNRVHDADQRYARWLLEVRDRMDSDDLRITQEFVAQMLGVRRPTVSLAAAALQEKSIITLERGGIRIDNVDALQRVACECYRVLQNEYDRLLGTDYPRRTWGPTDAVRAAQSERTAVQRPL